MILHSIENYCTLTQCNLILLCILQFSSYIREYKKVIDMTWESGTTAIGLRVCVHLGSVQCGERLAAHYLPLGLGWGAGDNIYWGLFRCKHFSSSKGDLHGHRVPL